MSENSDQKHATRWRKGQSGNPSGKPRGARHKATLAAQALLDGEAGGAGAEGHRSGSRRRYNSDAIMP